MIQVVNLGTTKRQELLNELKNGLSKYHDQNSYNFWEISDKLIRGELAWLSNGNINVLGRVFEKNQKRYFFVFYLWGKNLKSCSSEFVGYLSEVIGCTNIEFCSNTDYHSRLYDILSKKYKSTKSLTYDMNLGYNQ